MSTYITDSLTSEDKIQAFDNITSGFTLEGGHLELISKDRYGNAMDIIINDFIPDDPLCTAFGVTWHPDFRERVLSFLEQNLSIMAVCDQTDEVMGLRICCADKDSDDDGGFSRMKYDNLRDLFTFLTHKDEEVDFFNAFSVKEAVDFFILCVNRKFRRRGLGTTLMAAMVAFVSELGYKSVKGAGTSNFSQRIYEKQGFQTLCELPYDEYKYNGELIVNKTGEHKKAKIYGIAL